MDSPFPPIPDRKSDISLLDSFGNEDLGEKSFRQKSSKSSNRRRPNTVYQLGVYINNQGNYDIGYYQTLISKMTRSFVYNQEN